MSIETVIACAARGESLPEALEVSGSLVRSHGLGPLSHSLGADEFESDSIASSIFFDRQESDAREVIETITERGVPVMVIKGMAAARRHYDDPRERPMTDIDLLVPRDAHAEAAAAIRSCGFEGDRRRERGHFHHALTLIRPGASIDLHRSIVQPMRRGSRIEGLWLRAERAPKQLGRALVPEVTDEALLTLAHIARHELAVRALSYVDAARMMAKGDRGRLEERARRAKLWRGVRLALAFADAMAEGREPPLARDLYGEILARQKPTRQRQIIRKLLLLDNPVEAGRLGVGLVLELLGV